MRKRQFSEDQIAAIVREAGTPGLTVAVVAKQRCITDTTLFRWKSKFGVMDASQAAEMAQLHDRERAAQAAGGAASAGTRGLEGDFNARAW